MLQDVLRKLGWAAAVAAGVTCILHLFLGWLRIYPLGPEHPQFLPSRLFREDVLENAAWVTGLFCLMEIVALALCAKLVLKASCRLVLAVTAVVSAVAVVLFAFPVPWFHFDTPPGAVAFFLSFVVLTFALLYGGLHLPKFRNT